MRRARLARHAGTTLFGLASMVGTVEALAEVVVVVSAASRVTALTRHQVVDIFLGKTSRFPDGSLAAPIDGAEGSAARDEFYLAFAGKSPAQVNAHWSKAVFTGRGEPPPVAADAAALKKRLGTDPNAIGYLDESLVDASVKVMLPPPSSPPR